MAERDSDGSGGSMVTRFMLVRPIEIHCRLGCVTRGRRDIYQLMPDVLVVKVGLCALSLEHLDSMRFFVARFHITKPANDEWAAANVRASLARL